MKSNKIRDYGLIETQKILHEKNWQKPYCTRAMLGSNDPKATPKEIFENFSEHYSSAHNS